MRPLNGFAAIHAIANGKARRRRTQGVPHRRTAADAAFLQQKTANRLHSLLFGLEVPPGFGPGNEGFADLCLTTWLWHRINGAVDETRTRDLHLGKVALYQLSYYRRMVPWGGIEPPTL